VLWLNDSLLVWPRITRMPRIRIHSIQHSYDSFYSWFKMEHRLFWDSTPGWRRRTHGGPIPKKGGSFACSTGHAFTANRALA
jgi:hypothetical protein